MVDLEGDLELCAETIDWSLTIADGVPSVLFTVLGRADAILEPPREDNLTCLLMYRFTLSMKVKKIRRDLRSLYQSYKDKGLISCLKPH